MPHLHIMPAHFAPSHACVRMANTGVVAIPSSMSVRRAMSVPSISQHWASRHPNGYFHPHVVAGTWLVGNCLGMNIAPDLSAVWQPGSTVFSACTLEGVEVLLWLVPHVYGFESLAAAPPVHEVSFVSSSLRPPMRQRATLAPSVPLVPRWWVFEEVCVPGSCVCGMRTLPEAISLLPRRLAGQALAAHVDLHAAVQDRLDALHVADQTGPQFEQLRLALSVLSEDLRPLGLLRASSRAAVRVA